MNGLAAGSEVSCQARIMSPNAIVGEFLSGFQIPAKNMRE